MSKTKCDIIRDVIQTNEFCSLCNTTKCSSNDPCPTGQTCTGLSIDSNTNLLINYCEGTPTNCAKTNIVIDPALCDVPKHMDAKMRLFANKYLSLDRSSIDIAMASNDATLVNQVQQDLITLYPNNVTDVMSLSWPDIEKCIANPGINLPKGTSPYFNRKDYNNLSPPTDKWKYPIGRQIGAGKIWKSTESPSFLPLYVDYVMNPDFAAIFMIAFIILLFTVLMITVYRKNKIKKSLLQSSTSLLQSSN